MSTQWFDANPVILKFAFFNALACNYLHLMPSVINLKLKIHFMYKPILLVVFIAGFGYNL